MAYIRSDRPRCRDTLYTYKMAMGSIDNMMEMESVGYYRWPLYQSIRNLTGSKNMYGAAKVLIFLIGVFIIPATLIILPLYLKYKIFIDLRFAVTESDVFEITDGISPIFCEAQSLYMENSVFNAFQIKNSKIHTDRKKHFRLYKNMFLPDDSLEYWGFFLNEGSVVNLTLCSRFNGGRIMVVKDIKDFHTCGLTNTERKRDNVNEAYKGNVEVISQNSKEYEGEKFSEESLQVRRALKERYNHLKTSPPQNISSPDILSRKARSVSNRITQRDGILHGKTNDSNSDESSFERVLKTCYSGRILLNHPFPASAYCTNLQYLQNKKNPIQISHNVSEDGYYFYIFYSDNDEVTDEIQAIFDIFKPTFEYSEYERRCLNKSECTFPISFFSQEKVIVEIPMRDGIEHEVDDTSILVSHCQPRKLVYALFSIAVLVAILLFAFL